MLGKTSADHHLRHGKRIRRPDLGRAGGITGAESRGLHDGGDALSAADAHRHQRALAAGPFQLVERLDGQDGAGRADGVAERDAAAVRVGAVGRQVELAKHRQRPECASCHTKIDPPGFALESYDVIGGWRDYYRSVGKGMPVMANGRTMRYLKGPSVDAADMLPDGQKFRNIDEYKQLLLKDRDQLARALAGKLLTYATGGAPGSADRAKVDAIVGKVRDKNYGLRTLVHEVVQSELFQTK